MRIANYAAGINKKSNRMPNSMSGIGGCKRALPRENIPHPSRRDRLLEATEGPESVFPGGVSCEPSRRSPPSEGLKPSVIYTGFAAYVLRACAVSQIMRSQKSYSLSEQSS